MKSLLLAISGTSILAAVAALSCYAAGRMVMSATERSGLAAQTEQSQAVESAEADRTARSPRSKIYYAAIVERPLFAPNRRPNAPLKSDEVQEVVVSAEPVTSSERPEISVHGVMVDATGSKVLISAVGESPQWAKPGTKIGGWTVSDIGPDWVELSLASETFRFEMYQ